MRKYVFISPHLDDAALSCGAFIQSLKRQGKAVLVITVFTEFGSGRVSRAARKYLSDCGVTSADEFEKLRKNEDVSAMKLLKTAFYHLNFVDAFFRLRQRRFIRHKFIYPNRKLLLSGKIDPEDYPLVDEVNKRLLGLIGKRDIVYGPAGIGGHVDHSIVFKSISNLPNRKYLWLDLPYALEPDAKGPVSISDMAIYRRIPGSKEKKTVLECYSTQESCQKMVSAPIIDECIFSKKNGNGFKT